ncbi:hypothetical protein DM785_02740 [Deinococcus actinosclerus]|nr:hypothetical protein DM785_02740 [Deinococcus actinosclerus]
MTDGSRNSQDLENYNGVAVFVRAEDGRSVPVGPDAPMPMSLSASSGSAEGSRNSEDLERYNAVALFVRGPDGRSVPVGPDHPLPVTGDGLGGGGTAPRITRTGTGDVILGVDSFALNPIGRLGFTVLAGGNAVLTYDAPGIMLFASSGGGVFASAMSLPRRTGMDYTVQLTNNANLDHLGLALHSADTTTTFSGYRIAHLDTGGAPQWIVSKWLNNAESGITSGPSAGWPQGQTRTLRVTIDEVGNGVLYVDGAQVITWTDATYLSVRPGLFAFTGTTRADNVVAPYGVAFEGFPAGAQFTDGALVEVPRLIAPSVELSVYSADGVLITRVLGSPGDTFTYEP